MKKWFLITTSYNAESRWPYLKEHLSQFEIAPETHLAIDYKAFLPSGLSEQQAKHQSLTAAYMQIAERIIYEDIGFCMIMEDDICFKPEFSLPPIPQNADLIYLTQTEHNKEAGKTDPIEGREDLARVRDNWWETPITLWSLKFARRFVSEMKAKLDKGEWLGNIDH